MSKHINQFISSTSPYDDDNNNNNINEDTWREVDSVLGSLCNDDGDDNVTITSSEVDGITPIEVDGITSSEVDGFQSIHNDNNDSNESSTHYDIDDLISFKRLSLNEINVYDKYKESLVVLGYMGWNVNPTIQHMNSNLSISAIIQILTIDAELDIPYSKFPQIKKFIPKKILITPYDEPDLPDSKPNLLITLATLFYNIIKKTNDVNIDSMLSVLGTEIDIITQRNSLKKIFSYYFDRKEDWSIYVCQPMSNGPIYIERKESYPVNKGTIGTQFERAVTSKVVFNSVYAVSKGLLGKLSIAFTGEIDACTQNDQAVEIKSKPAWFTNDSDRDITNFIQSSLSDTNLILTGGFYRDKNDYKGPVVFLKKNIILQTLDEFCQSHKNISDEMKNNIYNYGANIMYKIKSACEKVGVVYEINSIKDDINSIHIRQLKEDEFDFPINETITRNTAEAIISISENFHTDNVQINDNKKSRDSRSSSGSRNKFVKKHNRQLKEDEFDFPINETTTRSTAEAVTSISGNFHTDNVQINDIKKSRDSRSRNKFVKKREKN